MVLTVVIGSNYGDRGANIKSALTRIGQIAKICSQSDIYETPDCLGTGLKYLNVVVGIEVAGLTLEAFQREMKELERHCGRNEEARKRGEVCIDIDIVLADGQVIRESDYRAAYFQKGYKELISRDFKKN